MKNKYKVEVQELKEVHEMPDGWSNQDYLSLLEKLEYADSASIPDDELKDMLLMALSDLEPEEAAELVLEYRFGDKLNDGQRQNISEELKDDRLWEEYSKIAFHEELFNVGCIMYWTFPKVFPTPDMVKLVLKITALNEESCINLKALTPSFIARLLTDGMDNHNAIYRLFEAEINSDSFPDANDIIWNYQESGFTTIDKSNELTIYTSWNWVDELKGVREFESNAHADGQLN